MVSALALPAFCGKLDVARQALFDGVWNSALNAADEVAGDSAITNAAERTEARLISLEALARMENDAEIRLRLSEWDSETSEKFRYWRARSLVRVGDYARAKRLLEEPFSDPSLALGVSCIKAVLLMVEKKYQDVIRELSGRDFGKEGDPVAEDARLMLAEAYDNVGRREEARALLLKLEKEASRHEIRLRSGYLLGFSEMDNPSTYTSGVARVRALLRSNPDDNVSAGAARTFADRLFKAGDAAGAEDEYRRYLEVFPSAALDVDILEKRGQALYIMGRYSEAAGAFARAEQIAEDSGEKSQFAYLQGSAFLSSGKFSAAAAGFERSASYGGKGENRSRFAQADALERLGNTEEASRIYSNLVGKGDKWGAKADLRLIFMAAGKGMLNEAIERYTKLLASPGFLSDDDVTEAHLGRGRACYRSYRFKEAAVDFDVVAARRPKLAERMRFLMALCLYGEGRDVEAKNEATALMASTKDMELRADLMLWCAKYEFNGKDYKNAQSNFIAYADFRKKGPSVSDALCWAARCSVMQMEYSKAVELATQAYNCAGDDKTLIIESLLVQGEALMELGRYPEARQLFERVAAMAPEGALRLKALMLKADALYAMGAGDSICYEESVEAYRAIFDMGGLGPARRIVVAFKIGSALEKLRRTKDAMDQYYRNVILAYCEEISKGNGAFLDKLARTFFSRAAFSLVNYYTEAGDTGAAKKMLERIVDSDVPAADEAKRRLKELNDKGGAE